MSTFGTSILQWETSANERFKGQTSRLGLSRGEVIDAEILLRFALSHGKEIDPTVTEEITSLTQKLDADSKLNVKAAATVADTKLVTGFRIAYQKLSAEMDPVNAQTIRNCLPEYGGKYGLVGKVRSAAGKLSYRLWYFTIFTLIFIFVSEIGRDMLDYWYGLDEDSKEIAGVAISHKFFYVMNYLLPFAYGLLGACTYLLRSSHFFAANFSFRQANVPEYYNRLLLGLIAGGAIQLFVAQIFDDAGTTVHLSSSALGFLAGYQVDFLFQAIERVIQAILPKVGLDSVARAKPKLKATATSPTELADKLLAAVDEKDKEALRALIRKLASG